MEKVGCLQLHQVGILQNNGTTNSGGQLLGSAGLTILDHGNYIPPMQLARQCQQCHKQLNKVNQFTCYKQIRQPDPPTFLPVVLASRCTSVCKSVLSCHLKPNKLLYTSPFPTFVLYHNFVQQKVAKLRIGVFVFWVQNEKRFCTSTMAPAKSTPRVKNSHWITLINQYFGESQAKYQLCRFQKLHSYFVHQGKRYLNKRGK